MSERLTLPTELERSLARFVWHLGSMVEARAEIAHRLKTESDALPGLDYWQERHAGLEGFMRFAVGRRLVGCPCGLTCECGGDEVLKAGEMDQLSKELFDALAAYMDQRIYNALTPRHQKQFSSRGLSEPAEPQAKRLQQKLHAFVTEHGKEKKRVAKKKSE